MDHVSESLEGLDGLVSEDLAGEIELLDWVGVLHWTKDIGMDSAAFHPIVHFYLAVDTVRIFYFLGSLEK